MASYEGMPGMKCSLGIHSTHVLPGLKLHPATPALFAPRRVCGFRGSE